MERFIECSMKATVKTRFLSILKRVGNVITLSSSYCPNLKGRPGSVFSRDNIFIESKTCI